ncbi:hypothetical protein [Sphingomonas qilianensis]|uniref:hypothetical protein n=1 Tax=Sphingomonas qilianensis TaxID=1736690 RepID=UPI0031F527AD
MAPHLTSVLRELAEATAALKPMHPKIFEDVPFVPQLVSALAEGADQYGAMAAIELGYRLQAILPLPQEDYRQDFDAVGARKFDALRGQADRILELPPQHSGREESYTLAGRAIIAHCDILIALWDGEPARGTGGTADVVSMALRRGVPVIHLAMQTGVTSRILWTGYEEFVDSTDLESMPFRLVEPATLHALAHAVIGPPTHPPTLDDLEHYLGERQRRARPRIEYPLLLALFGIKPLRRSAFASERYEEATCVEWLNFRNSCGPERFGVDVTLTDLERSFAWADQLAQHFGQIYRSGHALNFTLAASAVLIALTGLFLPRFAFPLAIAEASVIATFVANTLIGSRQQWHRRWLEYRQLAERVRPMRSLKLLGVASPPIAGRQGEGSTASWIEWYARAQWRAAGCPTGRLTDATGLTQAIVREELEPQIRYNHGSGHQMHVLDHRLHQVGIMLFCLTILSCILSVVVNLISHASHEVHLMFIVASAGLPTIGAAIFGIRMQGDFCSTAERSLITADDLTRIAKALDNPANSLARQTDLAEAAAATMLSDVAEWRRAYNLRTLQFV